MASGAMCFHHPNRKAASRCWQCGKPICEACLLIVDEGRFCSAVCSRQYRQYKGKSGAKNQSKRPSGLRTAVELAVFLGALAAAVAVAIHLGYVPNPFR